MALWLLTDEDYGRTVMYDSVSETAFGPGFYSREEAEDFGNWLDKTHGIRDARSVPLYGLGGLTALHGEWFGQAHDEDGDFRGTVEAS